VLLQIIEQHDPDFYLFSGDMVERGTDQTEWDAWFGAAGNLWTRKVLLPAHGNHEYLAQHYFAQFALPHNEQWFHTYYGDLTLVSLNDTVSDIQHLESHQVDYMDAVFGQVLPGSWKFGLHHQDLYSSCTMHRSNLMLRDLWGPVYDRHEVDVVLAGHNHIYERTVPIRRERPTDPGKGTVYLVNGGAGAPLYQLGDPEWFTATALRTEHYVIADFGPDEVSFVTRDLSDNVIDSFTVPRVP